MLQNKTILSESLIHKSQGSVALGNLNHRLHRQDTSAFGLVWLSRARLAGGRPRPPLSPEGRLLKMRIVVLVPLLISGMPNEKWDVSFTKSDFSLLKSHISLLYSHFSLMKSHIPLPTSSFSNITTDLEWKWQYVSPFLISHFLYPTSHLD